MFPPNLSDLIYYTQAYPNPGNISMASVQISPSLFFCPLGEISKPMCMQQYLEYQRHQKLTIQVGTLQRPTLT